MTVLSSCFCNRVSRFQSLPESAFTLHVSSVHQLICSHVCHFLTSKYGGKIYCSGNAVAEKAILRWLLSVWEIVFLLNLS